MLAWSHRDEAWLAEKFRVKPGKIASWISGEGGPTWNQLERLARLLNVPVTTFFRTWRIPEMPMPDFRRGPKAGSPPSPDLLSLIYDARRKQDWWKEQVIATTSPLVGAIRLSGDPVDAGRRMREVLGLDELQARSRSWEQFRRFLTDKLEGLDVLVLRRGHVRDDTGREIAPSEVSGFALTDPAAPVIYINARNYISAQIFTLIHEAVHVALNRPALDDDLEFQDSPQQAIEQYCDSVAAEALVPTDIFQRFWQGDPDKMARKFWVSTWVILRRALDMGIIRRDQYNGMLADYRKRISGERKRKSKGSLPANITAWNGRRFTDAVISRLRDGEITHTEAASLLWVSTRSLLAYLRSVQ
jgi:Zn-dependent peptidase ImmA (M78 family)